MIREAEREREYERQRDRDEREALERLAAKRKEDKKLRKQKEKIV